MTRHTNIVAARIAAARRLGLEAPDNRVNLQGKLSKQRSIRLSGCPTAEFLPSEDDNGQTNIVDLKRLCQSAQKAETSDTIEIPLLSEEKPGRLGATLSTDDVDGKWVQVSNRQLLIAELEEMGLIPRQDESDESDESDE